MANLNMARLSAYPVFLAVYEERRLVKAAERLCVTPSAVSHALRDFEQSLGTKLFERTSEGVQPTTAGQRLYAKVKPLVVGIEAAERELRSETALSKPILLLLPSIRSSRRFLCRFSSGCTRLPIPSR